MTTNQDLASALETDDRSQDAGTAGFEWTSETCSTEELAKIQGHLSSPTDSPVGCCAGVYIAEYASEEAGGAFLHWRFYKDPEWDA